MASALKNLSSYSPSDIPDASEMTFGIVVSEWNEKITGALLEGCRSALLNHQVKEANIFVEWVPGSFELPTGGKWLLSAHKLDAVICLGCVIKGETRHDEYINHAVSSSIMQLSLATDKPFVFGVLTTNDEAQALDRAGGAHGNKGTEAAITAIKMVALRKKLKRSDRKIGF